MSMLRKLFRPGAGAVIAEYTAAVAAETIYPADWVALSTVAPTSQGPNADGKFEGKTLGSSDYIECVLLNTGDAGAEVLCLGVLMGSGIGAVSDWTNVSGDSVADGDVVVIQRHGVHPQGRQVTGGVLGDFLQPSGVDGEVLNAATDAANDLGVALAATAAYQRVTAGDEHGSPVFIRL